MFKVYCPACKKEFTTERGVILHFRQALEGWDTIWNPGQPHTKWAQDNGISASDGYTNDFEMLKDILRLEISEQETIPLREGIDNLAVVLSSIHVNDQKRYRAKIVASHLVSAVLGDRWNHLPENYKDNTIQLSTNRLWNSYIDIRENTAMSIKGAAEKVIGEELTYLEQTLAQNLGI